MEDTPNKAYDQVIQEVKEGYKKLQTTLKGPPSQRHTG